ncbi:MAG TPA: hypothetical protein PLH36_10370 [Armatimonadota bacterium]|nr:hypothetical protein [Armatimonadota bacterium]
MSQAHPLDVLQSYRVGSCGATTELQRAGAPGIQIDFAVERLVDDVVAGRVRAVILTGTAGDGKTHLALRILDALGLDRDAVTGAQQNSAYCKDGYLIDLDLSAGSLTPERVERLHASLASPDRLTLVCANEGKLAELQGALGRAGRSLPSAALCINLSRRAIASPDGWAKVLSGVLDGEFWGGSDGLAPGSPLSWNRRWLGDPGVAERLRRYLLLPYLLGEPITVRETLSFLAYALGGGLSSESASDLPSHEHLRYRLFNTVFGEPDGHIHGSRSVPNEKLLWWLFRFDPGAQASPGTDLRLLMDLDRLGTVSPPPGDLLAMRQNDLVVRESEKSDTSYRERLARFMRYARRWYALASEEGFAAYFPFRHFETFTQALNATVEERVKLLPGLVQGLNRLLSGNREDSHKKLYLYHLAGEGSRSSVCIYNTNDPVKASQLSVVTDLELSQEADGPADAYLERFPRRLYLVYDPQPEVRLPISLLLYEVLQSAAGSEGAFPATLWRKERDTVTRFMGALGQAVGADDDEICLTIAGPDKALWELEHTPGEELVVS